MFATFSVLFAQLTNAATDAAGAPVNPVDASAQEHSGFVTIAMYALLLAMVYFAFFRPQIQAKKKQEETIKTAKTGDKIVTSSGIHGVITNVKDSTVIVKVADNVKLEIEKSHIDKITRPDSAGAESDKVVVTKS
jgi:preprotein translocase subunit YajC